MTQATNPGSNSSLMPAQDLEGVQATVLAAAINGNSQIRSQLPKLLGAFEEPYRTVAAKINSVLSEQTYFDKQSFGILLEGCRLSRRTAGGVVEPLQPNQVVNLIFATEAQPGQAEAYLGVLQAHQQAKQKTEIKDRVVELAKSFGDRPEELLGELERIVVAARKENLTGAEEHPSELLELIPYVSGLAGKQTGNEFLGLDSGFPHLNNLCNGLDTGLTVLAAPPGAGKTTLMWQIAGQAAAINKVPVVFVSLEQSKNELRAKALARLSKLQYRHILRGKLRSDDPQDLHRLLEAATEYARFSRHLTIIEGDDTTTIDKIYDIAAAKTAQANVERCVVMIDYLQVLPIRAQDGLRATNSKDRVDLHVSALRRMARKLDSPVLAISSENRAGYKSKQLDVFKESGGIEYSADIAMVLTRDKKNDPGAGVEYRSMDLNVVKNRNAERGVVKLKFYAKRAEFVETGKEELVEDAEE